MSLANHNDRAERQLQTSISQQRRIYFGERPKNLVASMLTHSMGTEEQLIRRLESQESADNIEKEQDRTQKVLTKKVPWYVIKMDSPALGVFKVFVSLFMLPAVVLNLYLIVFGTEANQILVWTTVTMELLFATELLLNFVTSYKDRETYDEIVEPRKIAANFVRYGGFVQLAIPLIPTTFLLKWVLGVTSVQVHQDFLCLKLVRLSRLGLGDFIPEASLLSVAQLGYKDATRQEKISKDLVILNLIRVLK